MSATVLHVSPHPDDELLGAPATLMALRDAGLRVVNLACGLGGVEQRARREAELREACRRAGFELVVPDRAPIAGSRARDRASVSAQLIELVGAQLARDEPEIVVSPSPHDRHPSHELVARAVREVLRDCGRRALRWWLWGLWGPLQLPTLGVAFDEVRLEQILSALGAYGGELERNDYRRLVRGRAEMNASLAPELLFGFGASGTPGYAELLTELVPRDGRWLLGTPRWLDPAGPLASPSDTDVGGWLAAPSVTDALGGPPPAAG